MEKFKKYFLIIAIPLMVIVILTVNLTSKDSEPLPSWNNTSAKNSIINFVKETTTEGNKRFVPITERIAVFDNDGTLWCEQPLYNEVKFSLESARYMLKNQDSATHKQTLQTKNIGEKEIAEAFITSHTAVSVDKFNSITRSWLTGKKHPRFNKAYIDLVYLPMVELLQYLRDHHFKVYIVSGGTSIFMRNFSREVYGIPPEQVIGTMLEAEYKDGQIKMKPKLWFNNDKAGKPEAIFQITGKKPVLAFGNSDGDYEMLEWTSTNSLPNLSLILHHTDEKREYAYDSPSSVGELKNALIDAPKKGWIVVDMKKDFKKIFNFE